METIAWMVAGSSGLLLSLVVYSLWDGRGRNDKRDWLVFFAVGGPCLLAVVLAAAVLLAQG